MKIVLVATLLVSLFQGTVCASLRATPKAPVKAEEKATSKEVTKELTGKVTDKVAETIAKALNVDASAKAPAAKAVEAAPAQPVQHKKLDVGFQDFEKNLTEEISAKLLRSASGTSWNDDSRAQFSKNITDSLKASMKEILKPVKMTIGKTWMALPKDEQKDEYVETLKQSFQSVFDNSKKTIDSHLELSLKRVEGYSKDKMTTAELLKKSESTIADSILTEHCYEVDAKKALQKIAKPANKTEILAEKKKFCIQSAIGALAHRLNDTQGLISMSMRFEAGAMSALQKKAAGMH